MEGRKAQGDLEYTPWLRTDILNGASFRVVWMGLSLVGDENSWFEYCSMRVGCASHDVLLT